MAEPAPNFPGPPNLQLQPVNPRQTCALPIAGKRKCDGKIPTCCRCERVRCACVYGQVGTRPTVTGGGTDRPSPARRAAIPPGYSPSMVETSVRAPSERTAETSPHRELAALLVRAPSEWVVGGTLHMAHVTGSIMESIARMKCADVLNISRVKAYLKRTELTINRAVGNDVIRYFRELLESEAMQADSVDTATSAVGPLTQKRRKRAAGVAHVLLSLEDQGSIWLRLGSGLKGSLEVTVSDAMAKLYITAEELTLMIKVSQVAPVYSWTRFMEPDSVATTIDALCRVIFGRESGTSYFIVQCQTRQGLSVRCHASIAWSLGVDQAASVLVLRLKPMVRLLTLSLDYHYITPHTLIAAEEHILPVCTVSASEFAPP